MLFGDEAGRAVTDEAARLMGRVLGWSRKETGRQIAAYREAVARMMAFRSQGETSAGGAGE
jgi:hypothetical protein